MSTHRAGKRGKHCMNYEMGGTIPNKTVKENDLGVTMNAIMKVSEQCRSYVQLFGVQTAWHNRTSTYVIT